MSITRPLVIGFALAAASAHAAPAQERFTLEQVMSVPFASDLVAAPRGGSIAWIVIERGARNVWVASAPAWQARQLTRYEHDDGQEIESLTFTPDGRSVIYVRGGSGNGAGGTSQSGAHCRRGRSGDLDRVVGARDAAQDRRTRTR